MKGVDVMKWFEEVFLPSLYEQRKNHYGKLVTFLTYKQAEICRRYLNERLCHGEYGDFCNYEGVFNDKKIQLCQHGKYDILFW